MLVSYRTVGLCVLKHTHLCDVPESFHPLTQNHQLSLQGTIREDVKLRSSLPEGVSLVARSPSGVGGPETRLKGTGTRTLEINFEKFLLPTKQSP